MLNRAEDAVTEAGTAAFAGDRVRDRGLSAIRNKNHVTVLKNCGDGHVERRHSAVEEEFLPLRSSGRVYRYRRGRSFTRGVVTACGAFLREIFRASWIHEDGFPEEFAVRCVQIRDRVGDLSRRRRREGVWIPFREQSLGE